SLCLGENGARLKKAFEAAASACLIRRRGLPPRLFRRKLLRECQDPRPVLTIADLEKHPQQPEPFIELEHLKIARSAPRRARQGGFGRWAHEQTRDRYFLRCDRGIVSSS